MRLFNRFWAIFLITTKRLLSQPWMALATVLGMVFAISLSMSVPLYASSVYNQVFLQRVGLLPKDQEQPSNFPPFTILFTYDSNILGNLNWPDVEKVNNFLETEIGPQIGLPVKVSSRYFSTNPLSLFPGGVTTFPDNQQPLMWSSMASIQGIEEHIDVVEGAYPQVVTDTNAPVEALIYADLAIDMGIQVGEQFNLFARNQTINGRTTTVSIPVVVTGVFQPSNPDDDFWFIKPELLEERLLVPEGTFAGRVAPVLSDEVYGAFWFFVLDGSSVRPNEAMSLARRILAFEQVAGHQLNKIKLTVSPVQALYGYQRAANLLTVLLFAFSVPIFGLLLAFIAMTAGMTVERQRNEIAVLRSRGAEMGQMVGMAVFESLLLGAIAMLVSLPISAGVALAIGRTRSFLDFSSESGLRLNWDASTVLFGVTAILLTLLARLMPTIRAARDNIVIYKRERARSLNKPAWQRMYLDLMLLAPAAYGMYQLRQSGSIDVLGASAKGDPFTNPLLIMVPALAIFSLALLFLRILPGFMALVTWIAGRTRSVGLMMAARHLARTPNTYNLPLVLLILTLSLSAFTATLAGTLDNHLYDQIYYRIGSDAAFTDMGDSPDDESGLPMQGGGAGTTSPAGAAGGMMGVSPENAPGWFFLPVTDYLELSGVRDATRVGRYPASAIFGSRYENGVILGVDRYNLPNVAFWRPDFADQSLGELMNQLAAQPAGILVTERFLERNVLKLEDLVTVRVSTLRSSRDIDFYVVGTFNMFPTFYPDEQELMIANLDFLFQELGGEFPYDVWLKTESSPVDLDRLEIESVQRIGARAIAWKEPGGVIAAEQARPERQGLFGVLSVGFAAAALLTVLGFLLYALLSYQRRFVELGVLRAIGLSAGQMTAFLAAELAFLIFSGGAIGTALGIFVSDMFIPYLQIGGADAQIPPYVVYVAWPAILRVYALFGLLFVVALGTLVVLLRRMRIFQAIKMGETV